MRYGDSVPSACVSAMLRRHALNDSQRSPLSATMPRLGRITGAPPRRSSVLTSESVSIRSPARKIQRRFSPVPSPAPPGVPAGDRSATASISTVRVPLSRCADRSSSSTANIFRHAGSVVFRKFGISTSDSSTYSPVSW